MSDNAYGFAKWGLWNTKLSNLNKMKAIEKCEVCGGKIIQAGNGNIFCEDCTDKNFGEKLQAWVNRKEKQRIVRPALKNER